jgi:hypothetical protein
VGGDPDRSGRWANRSRPPRPPPTPTGCSLRSANSMVTGSTVALRFRPPLVKPGQNADLGSAIAGLKPTIVRTNSRIPVTDLQSESDVTNVLDSAAVCQPDSSGFHLREVAATSHADVHLLRPVSSTIDGGVPINNGPVHLVDKSVSGAHASDRRARGCPCLGAWAQSGPALCALGATSPLSSSRPAACCRSQADYLPLVRWDVATTVWAGFVQRPIGRSRSDPPIRRRCPANQGAAGS